MFESYYFQNSKLLFSVYDYKLLIIVIFSGQNYFSITGSLYEYTSDYYYNTC